MIVKMCKPNFEAAILEGRKIHTIRPPAKRPILPGMDLSLRVWTGKPYRSPQREILRTVVTEVEGIRIHHDGVEFSPGTHRAMFCSQDSRKRRHHLERLAQRDGFKDWLEMRQWFSEEHGLLAGPFEGTLIHWRPPALHEFPCTDCGGDAFAGFTDWSGPAGQMIGKDERLCTRCARARGVTF